jgi:hypothetical protein
MADVFFFSASLFWVDYYVVTSILFFVFEVPTPMSIFVRGKPKLRMFENRVLRRIFGHKREKIR